MSPITARPWYRLDRHDDPAPALAAGTGTDPGADPTGGTGDPAKLPKLDGDLDPERAQRAIAAAREAERTAKAAALQAQDQARTANDQLTKVLAALGKQPDGSDTPPDPDALVAELTAQAENARVQSWRAGTTLAIYQAAGPLGADAEALLDSNQFFGLLDDLVEEDATTPEFAATVRERIQQALERWPTKYKGGAASGGTAPTGPRPDPSQGRGGTTQPVDFRTASPEAVAAELEKYRLRPYAR